MIAVERSTEEAYLTRIRTNQTKQHPDRGRLTRAIWTKESIHTRCGYEQVQLVNSDSGSEAARQPARLDQVVVLCLFRVNGATRDLLTVVFVLFVPLCG